MSKVEGGGVRLTPLKASCNYFFFEASRVKIKFVFLVKHAKYAGIIIHTYNNRTV